jgi:hypothetical protein
MDFEEGVERTLPLTSLLEKGILKLEAGDRP